MNKEIQRLQELAGINYINEIKVNNPSHNFQVTPKGIQAVNDFIQLEQLADKFEVGELLKDEGPEKLKYRVTQLLYIFSDTNGEGIIKMNNINTIEAVSKMYAKRWDPDVDNLLEELRNFMELGYITPIKL